MIELRAIFAVAGGAAVGGVLRLLVMQSVIARIGAGLSYLATFAINVSGSFLIGIVLELAMTRANFNPLWRLFLATGILGGYTTFSTFAFETWTLGATGLLTAALLYAVGSVLAALLGVFGGITFARALSP